MNNTYIDISEYGYILIQGVWEHATVCVFNIHIMHTDAASYNTQDPDTLVKAAGRLKEKKHIQLCLNQCHNLTPSLSHWT
jgi:hypothetical protein